MAPPHPQRPNSVHASEPPQQTPNNTATTAASTVQFPPPKQRCPKCQPILQHRPHSSASVPANHTADSSSLVTPACHATVRHYIGPLPVPASAARAIARAIVEDTSFHAPDVDHEQPEPNNVSATDFANAPHPQPAQHSHTFSDPFQAPAQAPQHSDQQGQQRPAAPSPPTSPSSRNKTPTPLPSTRPRVVARDPSSASVLSNTSFVSAKSLPRSALSDSEAAARRPLSASDGQVPSSHDAPASSSRPVSPSRRRLGLLTRKSNQSFPSFGNTSLPPPASILKPSTPNGAALPRLNSDATDESTSRHMQNVRSAENLRVAALRQQRRIGSEGSKSTASTVAPSPNNPPLALPILDLPLDQIEEAITPQLPAQASFDPPSPRPEDSASSPQFTSYDTERRAFNTSNDTTIIRKSDEIANPPAASALRNQTSFSSGSEAHPASDPAHTPAKLQPDDLLHPTWEQSNLAPNRQAGGHIEAGTALSFSSHDDQDTDAPQRPDKLLPGIGRGLPTKRSLTFSREPSAAHPPRQATGSHLPRAVDHPREYSRQTRISRASTAGTFNTVGTIATEGSFGATAGNNSTLARKFFAGGSFRRVSKRGSLRRKLGPVRTNSVRDTRETDSPSPVRTRKRVSPFAVRARKPARSTSYASMHRDYNRQASVSGTEASVGDLSASTPALGVLPGAVGTSAGGTKWVGASFQIGKRFWDILEARRDDLQRAQPCSCSKDGANDAAADETESPQAAQQRKKVEEHAAKVDHLKQSPDGVITLLAQEAQDISDDKASAVPDDHPQGSSTPPAQRPSQPSISSVKPTAGTKTPRRKLSKDDSLASIQSLHPDAAAPLAIEARQGWSEIVSKMSSLTEEIGTGLKTRTAERRQASSESKKAKQKEKEQYSSGSKAITQSSPAEKTSDPNVKIVARSSSLADTDSSSAASKSAYVSLNNPSTYSSSYAPRTSSLATEASPAMTRKEALSHPAPPASLEKNDPQLVHQLLRRKSDLGERPDLVPDAASDHAVVLRQTLTPQQLTPGEELVDPSAIRLTEQDPFPVDATPNSEGSIRRTEPAGKQPLTAGAGESSGVERKKTVKFDTGSSRPALKGRFTASLFAGRAETESTPLSARVATAPGDAQPRPPEEVLARPQPDTMQLPKLADGSDTFSESPGSESVILTRRSVLKKDRMLVKLAWTPHEDLPNDFDELQARKYPIRDEDWREFIVVFRMGKLELWTDPSLTSKIVGHGDRLKLRTTIPLSRGSTFLSLYSPIDRIFCLTYQPWKSISTHHGRKGIHLRRQGTDIVLFDCRARSAAADWMWELWRELGGHIPESLEVHVPSFGLKIKMPVPESMPVERTTPVGTPGSQSGAAKGGVLALSSIGDTQDGGEGFKLINRDNIVSMTWKLLSSIPQWHDLMVASQARGVRLDLAWRRGNELDWIVNERTVDNEPRHWAVLCGALLRDYKHPSILELRTAAHYPTTVETAPGQFLHEPPAVEGFLWRVKPVSGALTRLYFTTYDGHLYVCRTARAFPPDRHLAAKLQEAMDMRVPKTSGATQGRGGKPIAASNRGALARALSKVFGTHKAARRDEDVATLRQNVLEAISYPAETEEELQAQIAAYESFERRRQFEQIRGSDGFIDLKLIHTIKTIGKGPVRCPGQDDLRRPKRMAAKSLQEDVAAAQHDDEESDDDEEDELAGDIGGQEGLEVVDDANELRRARQIEITLTNGKRIRLEAFSASVAREWVERVAELVKYWRRRERVDAMELMYASGVDVGELRKELQGEKARRYDGVDEQKLSPILGSIWNWCAIEACRNIVRSGRLFHKKSSYGAFKARDYVLIAGRLLCFKLVRSVRTSRARQNNGIFHRRQDMVIHLRDAYVYSGKLSEDMLKNGRSEPAQAVSGLGGGGSNSGKRHRVPRVYADGMFSVDDDEDCTFVIRYRPERVNTPADPGVASAGKGSAEREEAGTPALDDKTHKYVAMRARSRMERDVWVRCIAYEIERIVRADAEREARLRNAGSVDHRR
ncbi:hypothetical protein PANT_3c00032 [Moesziomyces antarcticus T-34]|uniref:PH domain-containing protein n=1 Tax=Pseudozyma antarctica (strain T-34) TaxID=1151754 RepID=M9LSV7_PSEA3|nr:hypothetical protein PANT_3c00032 [Moesziomyces antarcticus T-34]